MSEEFTLGEIVRIKPEYYKTYGIIKGSPYFQLQPWPSTGSLISPYILVTIDNSNNDYRLAVINSLDHLKKITEFEKIMLSVTD